MRTEVSSKIYDATELPRKGVHRHLVYAGLREAVGTGAVLGFACLVSYFFITQILGRAYFASRDDELLGGMWSVIATLFVYRHTYEQSVRAALSRMTATLLSFALCLAYLLIFPFHAWGLAALIGIGAIIMMLTGRSEDIITTGISTAVVMVVAGISPQHAWKTPILRLIDTAVGVVVGIAAARIVLTSVGHDVPSPVRQKLKEGRKEVLRDHR